MTQQVSPRTRLLAHSQTLLRWFQEPGCRLFSEYLEHLRLQEQKKLHESKDTVDIYRAQGAIGIIDVLKSLEEDLKRYERDVASGACQPVKEQPNVV